MSLNTLLITIGDELLSGRTVNTNAAYIGKRLSAIGAPVCESLVIGDDRLQIVAAVHRGLTGFDVAVITGGLGPTHDDITVEAVAAALGVELERDDSVYAAIETRYRHLDRAMPAGVEKMALIPRGARVLTNNWGTAPGLHIQAGRRHLFVLPGVPAEMQGILDGSVLPALSDLPGRAEVHIRALATTGIYESKLSELLSDLIPGPDDPVKMAFLPNYSGVELRLITRSDRDRLNRLAEEIIERIGDSYLGEAHGEDLVARVSGLLCERRETLVTAESCTGGLIGKLLTDRPGASAFYLGGVVAYSNGLKEQLLGVPQDVLVSHGAVSSETALAMAAGARERLGATYALSVTGIAGPEGEAPDKPVGLIYLGLAAPDGTSYRRLQLSTHREQNRTRSAFAALNYLRRHIEGHFSAK